jgi:hypothetical protein
MSVTIPPDSGRRLMVWLTPPAPGQSVERDAFNAMALQERLEIRKPSSTVWTREDILNSPMKDLMDFVNHGRWQFKVNDRCPAIIDGGPRTMSIWVLRAEDIETIEIYPPKSLPNPQRPPARSTAVSECEVVVYVWLRR